MTLRNDEKDWVLGAIREAISAVQPHGWRRWVRTLREIGPIIGTCAFIIALVGVLVAVSIFASNRLREEAEFRGSTKERLRNIESGIEDIRTELADLRLRRTSDNPSSPAASSEAKKVLAAAQKSGIRIPQDTLQDAGERFIQASRQYPTAWNAVLALVDYRAFENIELAIDYRVRLTGGRFASYYTIFKPWPNAELPSVQVFGLVPVQDAARFNQIGKPREETNNGSDVILMNGGNVLLDRTEARKVVFVHVHVVYRGGPIILNDVMFVGCTFDITRNDDGQQLASIIINSPLKLSVNIG